MVLYPDQKIGAHARKHLEACERDCPAHPEFCDYVQECLTEQLIEVDPTFAEIKEEFLACEKEYAIARKEYNDALEALQQACTHQTVVGGNEQYGDIDMRVCVTCGLFEVRGYEGGDEYNYGHRTKFAKLPLKSVHNPNGTIAYKPDSDKDVYRWRKLPK